MGVRESVVGAESGGKEKNERMQTSLGCTF